MRTLYENRSDQDKAFIQLVCNDILTVANTPKEKSDDFCAVFVEGRNRTINCLEDAAAIHSFKVYSEYDYPVFAFVHNPKDFLNNTDLESKRITIIEIPEINSLESYSDFCINWLYFNLPRSNIENIITLQPDGMLLRAGYEDWLKEKEFSLIGARWRHSTSLEFICGRMKDYEPCNFPPTNMANLGFSFRKASLMRDVASIYKGVKFRQRGDFNCPEDAYFSYLFYGYPLAKKPTNEEADQFSVDPLTLDKWLDKKNLSFGFHYFKSLND